MKKPWTRREVIAVLLIGMILGYLLGIWTPDNWLESPVW